jgi:hypothetical protein
MRLLSEGRACHQPPLTFPVNGLEKLAQLVRGEAGELEDAG